MTFEEFWELYSSNSILDLYDEIIEVFSKTLPEEVYQEYDVGEVITEFSGHYEKAKKFDEIQTLTRVLKAHNAKVYEETYLYLNEALINYYCYTRNAEALQEPVQEFLTQWLDYDMLLLNFYRLVYYQHQELANRIIEDKYEEVQNSKDLIQGAEYDLAMVKQHMLLETLANSVTDKVEEANWQQFKQAAGKYNFEFEEIYRQNLEDGLLRPQELIERMQQGFLKGEKRTEAVSALGIMFSQAMSAHHLSFAISGIIWNHLHEYWESQKANSWQDFFRISEQKFEGFVNRRSGLIIDYRIEIALILWGSYYVLDFLHEQGLLTEQSYEAQQAALTRIKQKFMDANRYSLWEYDFVHDWAPPRRITPEDWQSEKEAFAHSFTLVSKYQELEDMDFPDLSDLEDSTPNFNAPAPVSNATYMPASVNKIGRNEKVSVRYEDGTVKKDIKYKKVADDLSAGRCELL